MFSGSNFLILLMCIMPAVLYSLIIYFNAPENSIKKKTSITYLYTGLLSTTIMTFVFLLFPNIRSEMFNTYIGRMIMNGVEVDVYIRTFTTLLFLTFIQIALFEECCKYIALKLSDYSRGKRKKDLDSPYAIMFYCSLISAAFAIMESINYVQRTMAGEFGLFITPKEVLFVRSFTSVVLHMVCGLFMGYFIAISKGKSLLNKIILNGVGIIAATIAHGIYDFMLMKSEYSKEVFYITKTMCVHPPTIILLSAYVTIAYAAAKDLKNKHKFITH